MQRLHTRLTALYTPLILAALSLLFMAPFITAPAGQQTLDGHDLVNQVYPLFSFIFGSVRDGGGLPLWNPYQFGGQSAVGNPQSTMFYPPAWLMVPLGVGPGIGWLVLFHLWLGGWGMAAFARRLGASRTGALAGGIVYEFSALLGAHLDAGHFNYILCAAWLPWVATAYLASVETGRWLRPALLGAMALGLCALTGYPPLLYFAGLWLVGLWVYVSLRETSRRRAEDPLPSAPPRATFETSRRRAAWQALRPLLVIAGGGAILGAVMLLPVGQLSLTSTRVESASLEFSGTYPLTGSQLITLLFPNIFGQPRLAGDGYWGVPFYEELTAYIGILPIVAFFLVRRRPGSTLLRAFCVLGLIVSLGIDGGLFPFLYRLLPGYSLFRAPSRALYFVVVGAAGLTALFVSDLQTTTRTERMRQLRTAIRTGLPWLVAFAIAASFALGAYFTANSTLKNPPWRVYYSASMIAITAVMAGAAWLLLRLWLAHDETRQPKWTRHALSAATVALVLVDVWHISGQMVNVSAVDVPDMWQAMARAAPPAPDYRVMTVPGDRIVWQSGAEYTHHLNAGGYDPLISDAYKRLLDASQYNPTSRVSRLLGVKYALTDTPVEKSHLAGSERLKLASEDGGWYIYEVSDPLPRVFVAARAEVGADDEAARRQLASDAFDPAATAFVDHPVACTGSGSGAPARAQITRYEPDAVEIESTTGEPGILVLSDAYDPNWSVSVDGAPAELLRVDTALRGVCLPPGTHQVSFSFQPRLFTVGLAISAIGWPACIAATLFLLIGNKQRSMPRLSKPAAG